MTQPGYWTAKDVRDILLQPEDNRQKIGTTVDDNKFLMGISYTDLKKMTENDLRKLFPKAMVDDMVLILKESRVDLKKEANTVNTVLNDDAFGGF